MRFTRNIWLLALISLFTDMASEMLYPVMPLYLKHIGFSLIYIGILEGVAEAVAGLSKGFFGQWSDRSQQRKPFVAAGYAASALAKPMIGFFSMPLWIFSARTLDRLGKGIRTGARDAMLSDEATLESKGKVFGFHRSMDTIGAIIGPAIALVFLNWFPGKYRDLFFWAFIPGIFAIIATLLLKERKKSTVRQRPGLVEFLQYWRNSPVAFRRQAGALLIFSAFNSADTFLLLRLNEIGVSATGVIGFYILYNMVYAASAYPLGILADRLGLQRILGGGLVLFALVYAGMAANTSILGFYAIFLIYGLYSAATDGVSKALLSNLVPREQSATAIGTFSAFQSLCVMMASSITGVIWHYASAPVAFSLSALVAAGVGIYFIKSIYKIN